MDLDRFWEIIAEACRSDLHLADEWDQRLHAELIKLSPEQIIQWGQIYRRMTNQAFMVDLWGAAYLIKGGASDDGFYYFRCW